MRSLAAAPLAIALAVALSSCAARGPRPNAAPVASAPVVDPADALLALAPATPAAVLRVRPAALRALPWYASLTQQLLRSPAGAALGEHCGDDPLASVETAALWLERDNTPGAAVTGPLTSPERRACRDAWLALFGRSARDDAPASERVRWSLAAPNTALVTPLERAAPAPEANAQAREPSPATQREALALAPPAALTGLLDLEHRGLGGGPRSFPHLEGVSDAELAQAFDALRALRVDLDARGEGLALRFFGLTRRDDEARAGARVLEQLAHEGAAVLRRYLDELAQNPAAASVLPPVRALAEQLAALRAEHRATRFDATLALDAGTLQQLAFVAIPAFVEYNRRARTAEALANLEQLAVAASAYAEEHRAAPVAAPVATRPARRRTNRSAPAQPVPPARNPQLPEPAPRTPDEVPRGVAVTNPPEAWQHPTWRALRFAPTSPHRFSYEVLVDGRTVTLRAYGDLDGDGQRSTFERRGELDEQGVLRFAPGAYTQDPTE